MCSVLLVSTDWARSWNSGRWMYSWIQSKSSRWLDATFCCGLMSCAWYHERTIFVAILVSACKQLGLREISETGFPLFFVGPWSSFVKFWRVITYGILTPIGGLFLNIHRGEMVSIGFDKGLSCRLLQGIFPYLKLLERSGTRMEANGRKRGNKVVNKSVSQLSVEAKEATY